MHLSIFLPSIASAQAGTYTLIAPIGTLTGALTLEQYLNGMFTTIIGIAGILAVLMLVICGIKLMGSGSVSGKSEAKQCIWNAIFGLLLAIGSWILLNTINPILLKSDGKITVQTPVTTAPATLPTGNDPMPTTPGWYFRYTDSSGAIRNSGRFDNNESCNATKDTQNANASGSVQSGGCWEEGAVIGVSEGQARKNICGNTSCVGNSSTGVYVSKNPCASVGAKGCVNADGLSNAVGTTLATLKTACGPSCTITITGGTEYWLHATHAAGKDIFDIAKSPAVDNAIMNTNPSSKRSSYDGYFEWLYDGFWYTDEGTGWHVCKQGIPGLGYCAPISVNTGTYNLSATKSGGATSGSISDSLGFTCGNTCPSLNLGLTAGTNITLTATPAPGLVFSGWGGACSGFSSCRLTMNTNKSVTANFTASGGGGGNTPPIVSTNSTNIDISWGFRSFFFSTWTTPTDGDPILGYVFGGGNLPSGMTFDATSGIFSGTPTQVGTFTFQWAAKDKDGTSGFANFTITVTNTSPFVCGTSVANDSEGNIYNTVMIASQCWLRQNMRVGTMVTGGTMQTNNGVIEKHCYSDNLSTCMHFNNPNFPDGGLYQWDEAMQYSTTPGAQGICPAGWHIPTHDEFTHLERAVCTSGTCTTDFPYDTTTTMWRGTNEGIQLKPNGTKLWEGNISGYSSMGIPVFQSRGGIGVFWTSVGGGAMSWTRALGSSMTQVSRIQDSNSHGYSVRCLKDASGGNYTLTVSKNVNAGGEVGTNLNICPTACIVQLTETRPSGDVVSIYATPASGYIFDSWGGDCSSFGSSPNCTITMTANKNVTANFTPFTCGISLVNDSDGNTYRTVQIGSQCWMKENMRVGTRTNLSTGQWSNGFIDKYCYNDIASNCTSNHPNYPDGGLYQWDEAMQYSTTPGAQGICPAGWHIPTHDEWTTLERAVCVGSTCATDFPYDTTTLFFRGTSEGIKLNTNGTSGFEATIAGNGAGSFSNRDVYSYFWSSTEFDTLNAWRRSTAPPAYSNNVYRGDLLKYVAASVRCMKN